MRRVLMLLAVVLLAVGCRKHHIVIEVSVELRDFPGVTVSRLVEVLEWRVAEAPGEPIFLVYDVTIQGRKLVGDDLLTLYDAKGKTSLVVTEEMHRTLAEMVLELRAQVFGAALSWTQASQYFPRMGYATVVDLETGMLFKVQRRAGSDHADVQPLTRDDTSVMKAIYGGTWSWDRRAILVVTDSARIAASMNGMPHGKGALPNNFNGHFCIHFLGCTTHRSSALDHSHQLMVSKAAGAIWSLARDATPEEQVRNFLQAVNEKDFWMAALFSRAGEALSLAATLSHVQSIKVSETVLNGPTVDTANIRLRGEIIYNTGKRKKFDCEVRVFSRGLVWLVDPEFILRIVNP